LKIIVVYFKRYTVSDHHNIFHSHNFAQAPGTRSSPLLTTMKFALNLKLTRLLLVLQVAPILGVDAQTVPAGLRHKGNKKKSKNSSSAPSTTPSSTTQITNAFAKELHDLASEEWENHGVDALIGAVKIDSLSVNFDQNWYQNGKLRDILNFYDGYVKKSFPDLAVSSTFYENGTDTPPCVLIKIPGTAPNTTQNSIMMYAHADTQPYNADEWTYQSDPTEAIRFKTNTSDIMYGRGTTDNKHGPITTVCALKALLAAGKTFPDVYILIETGEESGSPGLDNYLNLATAEMGNVPAAVYILDAFGPSWNRYFNVRTIRGFISATIKIIVAESAKHSMYAGILPNPFDILNDILLTRVADLNGTAIAEPLLYSPTQSEIDGANELAELFGSEIYTPVGFYTGVGPMYDPASAITTADIGEMVIRNFLLSRQTILGWNHEVSSEKTR
jgi:hypothetical protein